MTAVTAIRREDLAPAPTKELNGILARAGRTPFPVKVSSHGDLVALTVGRTDAFDALLGGPTGVAPAPALAAHKPFTDTLGALRKSPSAAMYVPIAIARNSAERMLARCFGEAIHLSTANAPGSS